MYSVGISVNGSCSLLVVGCRLSSTDCIDCLVLLSLVVVGSWVSGVAVGCCCWLLVVGCCCRWLLLVAGCRVLLSVVVVGSWLSGVAVVVVVSSWLSGVAVGGCCLFLVVGCLLSVFVVSSWLSGVAVSGSNLVLVVGCCCRLLLLVPDCRVLLVDFLCRGCHLVLPMSVPSSVYYTLP
jgi:hypothetical protein